MKVVKRFKVLNYDKLYHETKGYKVVLNDLPVETEEDRLKIDNLIMTTYENTDILSPMPSCGCGELTGGFRLGQYCGSCNSVVARPAETDIEHNVWLRAPEGIKGFINPNIWVILSSRLSGSNFNLMEWITDPSCRIPPRVAAVTLNRIKQLQDRGWKRGLNNFIENYDAFIDLLPRLNLKGVGVLQEMLRTSKPDTFSRYLPMPSKLLLVMENTNRGSYADLPITGAIDAARTISALSRVGEGKSVSYLERKTVGIIKNLSFYYQQTGVGTLRRKRGWFRGQIFSSRANFSFRSVITSIHEPHHYEELHVPWSVGVEVLKFHLVNRLKQLGYNVRDAFELVEGHERIYHPVLDKLMEEIIADTEEGRLPTIFQRNC